MALITPTFIYPKHFLPTPSVQYRSYGVCITQDEAKAHIDRLESALANSSPKALVIFVGGFCDTIMRAVYREFEAFNMPFCLKIYASFKCEFLLREYLPKLDKNLPIFIIAHSWGASNVYRALSSIQTPHINYLLTLDAVGYRKPKIPLKNVALWENIYIKNKILYPHRSNFLAIIGHAWNEVKLSNHNAFLTPPAHHASINQMITLSSFENLIRNLL